MRSQICGTIGQCLARLELAAGDHLPQVHAIDIFHEEVVQPAGLAEVMQCDDVRVIEPRQRPGLACESLFKSQVPGNRRRQDLEGNQPVQPPLASLVNGSHATLAEQLQDLEVRKMAGQLVGIGRYE